MDSDSFDEEIISLSPLSSEKTSSKGLVTYFSTSAEAIPPRSLVTTLTVPDLELGFNSTGILTTIIDENMINAITIIRLVIGFFMPISIIII